MADSGEKGVGCASVMRQARKVAAACWGMGAAHSWKKWRGRGLAPRGPLAPPHRAAQRRAGGGGSGSAGSGGCGRWMAAGVQGNGGVGGRCGRAAMRDREEGTGSQGACLVGAGAGGGAGACTPLEGSMTGGRGQRGGRAPGRGSHAPKGGGRGQRSVTKGPRADPGKRDPGLRGDPAKRDQGAPG